MKKNLSLLLALLMYSVGLVAQVTYSESFDVTPFVPAGWTNFLVSGSNTWTRVTTGTFPTCSPHTGAGMAKFNSFSASGGVRAIITPSYDLSGRGAATPTVSFWTYRDAGYATTADKLDLYMNTAPNLAGATLLGTVNRSNTLAPATTVGWHQYTFNVPIGYNGTTNYFIIKGTSAFGDNIFVDDVSWQAYPPPCSGTPTAGTASASVTTSCGPATSNLTLTGYTTSSGITFQWQSSPDNITFTPIAGATNTTYAASVSSTSYYNCLVTCVPSSSASTSNTVTITINPIPPTISGATPICAGYTASLTDAMPGGTWSSSNGAVATIGTGGTVTGVAVGSTIISYIMPTGCYKTTAFVVVATPPTPSVSSSASTVCNNSGISLTGSAMISLFPNESWESGVPVTPGSLVDGWNTDAGSTAYITQGSSGTTSFPNASAEDGTYFAVLHSFSYSGITPSLFSPAFNMVGVTGGQISFWVYREYGGYYTGYYGFTTEGWQVGINTSPTVAGATALGAVPRAADAPTTGVTGASTVSSSGWQQYTVNIPPAFNGATNYIIFRGVSQFGDDCYLDNIQVTGNAPASWSPTTYLFTDPGFTTPYTSGGASPVYLRPTGISSYTNLTYTASVYCSSASTSVTVSPTPAAITGTSALCTTQSTTLGNTSTGGIWSSTAPGVATINSTSGIVNALVAGTTTISYTFPGCGSTTLPFTVTYLPDLSNFTSPGITAACQGLSSVVTIHTTSLASGTYTITYNLGGANIATGNTATLTMGGGGTGTFTTSAFTNTGSTTLTITSITNGSCNSTPSGGNTVTFTVNPVPSPISGNSGPLCQNFTLPLADIGAGAWSSSDLSMANVTTGGLVTGVGAGNPIITFTQLGCIATTTLTINAAPQVFNVTGGGSYCPTGGIGVHIGLNGSQSGISYQLKLGASSPIGPVSGSGSSIDFGLLLGVGTYSVVATNTVTSCPSNMSGTASVSYSTLPIAYTVTGGGNYCPGGSGVHIGLNNSELGLPYQLLLGGVPAGPPVTGTGMVLDMGTVTTAGTYTIQANYGTPCFNNMSGSVTVGLASAPTAYTVTGGGAYCAGGTGYHIFLSTSDLGINYQLLDNGLPVGSLKPGTSSLLDMGYQTAGGTYTVLAVNPSTTCTTLMTGSPAITVNPTPVAYAVTGGGGYCAGGSGVAIGLSNSANGINYQLKLGASNIGGLVSGTTGIGITFGTISGVGTYTVVATDATTGCPSNMTGSATVTINPLPTAFVMGGGGNYCAGGAGMPVTLSGSTFGVNYQLYNGVFPQGAAVAGTGFPITFGPQPLGFYTAVGVNGTTGCSNNMSGLIMVNILAPPAVYSMTGGGQYCTGGSGVDVGLSWSDPGVNYQLYLAATPVGPALAGIGGSLDFGFITTPGVYTVVATNGNGCTATMAGVSVVTATPPPQAFTVTGGGSYCIGGSGVLVGLSNSKPNTKYLLYNGSTLIAGPIVGTGLPFNFGLQTLAGGYTITGTDIVTGCTSNMTGSANIVINSLPNAYAVTGGGNYCVGGTGVHIGTSASDGGILYQLYKGVSTVGSPVAGTGAALDFGLQTTTGTYTVIASNPATTCSGNMLNSVNIGTNPTPPVQTVTGGGPYCPGGTGRLIGLDGSVAGIRYQLYKGLAAIGSPVAGTGSPVSFGSITTTGTYTVIATDTLTLCTSNMTGSATISLTTPPVAYAVSGGGSFCSGGLGVNIGISGSASGVNYQLFNGVSPASGLVPGTGTVLGFGPQTAAGVYTVVATDPVSTCSTTMFGTAAIVVNPLPAIDTVTGGGSYCSGSAGVPVGLNASDPGVNYQLYLGALTNGPLMLGNGLPINFGIKSATGTYTAMATIAATGCSATMYGNAVVSITSLPAVFTVNGGGSYCDGGAGVLVGMNGSESGINYTLYVNGLPSGSSATGSGTAISFGLQTAPGTYTVIASNDGTGCQRNMTGSVVVTINPLPNVYDVSGGGSYCPGGTGVHVLQNGSDGGINYQVMKDGFAFSGLVAGTGSYLDFGSFTPAGIYKVLAVDATSGCSAMMADSAIISLNTLPTPYSVIGGGGYCPGGSGMPVEVVSSQEGVSYQLYLGTTAVGSPVTGSGDTVNFGLQTAPGTYTVVGTNLGTGCSRNMTGSAVVSINALPNKYMITGGGNYCPGGSGVHVGLSGSQTGISYQLMMGATDEGSPMSGATGTALDFGLLADIGDYTVVATDAVTGCNDVMNGTVHVGNLPAPAIYIIGGGGNYCIGGSGVSVTLAGSEAGISYQLFRDGTATGSPMTGTGSGLDFGSQTVAGTYSVIATNPATFCTSNMSGSVTVNIIPLPAVYTLSGSGNSYCAGGAGIQLTIGGTAPGIDYQLYLDGVAAGAPVAGTGYPINLGHKTAAGTYTMIAIDSIAGCSNMMAGSVSISINPLPTVYPVTGGGAYCMGGTGVHISLTGSSNDIHYQLYIGSSPAGPTMIGTGSVLDFGPQTALGTYSVIATNTVTACSAVMSGTPSVSTLPLPVAHAVTGGGAYCAGGTGVHISLPVSDAGISYQLYMGTTIVSLPMEGTASALDFGAYTAAGTYKVIATNDVTGCTNEMSNTVPVIINPLPVNFTTIGGGNYCPGGTGVNVGLSGSASGTDYKLYYAGVYTGSTISGTGGAINFGLQTTTGSYTVIATNASTGCVANMAGAASVGLYSLPAVFDVMGGGNYCSGGTGVHITLSGSESGTTYQLYNSSPSPSGSAISGTGAPVDFGLVTGADVYTAVATNTATGCSSNMTGTATVIVNTPVGTGITVSTGMGDSLCSGNMTTFSATAANGGASPAYHWSINGVPISASGSSYSYVPVNGDRVTVTMTTSAYCALPANTSDSVTLVVSPTATPSVAVHPDPAAIVCQGTLVTYGAIPTYGGPSPAYQWVVNGAYTGTDSTYSYIANDGDIVKCILTSDYYCRLSTRVSSPDVNMTVVTASLPVVTITANPGNYLAEGQTVTLSASVTNAGPAPTYQWIINGDPVPGAIFPDLTRSNFNDNDVVTCQVISSGVCSGQVGFNTVTIHIGTSGVKQVAAGEGDVIVTPNPNRGQFTVRGTLSTTGDEMVTLELSNMLGQVVYHSQVMTHYGQINEIIRLENNVANGMYLLNFRSETDNKVFHVVIEQ